MKKSGKLNFLNSVMNCSHNELEEYDNVTYNIRFYMLPYSYQQELSKHKNEGDVNFFKKIDDNAKIIIAETGVSSNYDITSLTMETVHTSVYRSNSATTYKINLILKELNGCSLLNKIAVISKVVGYQNHYCQPYHLDIWFSGYEHSTGKEIKQIGEMLTYEVIISEVTSNISENIAHYNFIMVPVTSGSFNKTINSLWSNGVIKIEEGMNLGEYKKKIEKSLNDVFFNNNPNLKAFYPSEKYVYIDNLIMDKTERNLVDFVKDEHIKGTLLVEDIESVPVQAIPPENEDESEGKYDVFGNKISDTFDGLFQRLCTRTEQLKDYIARPVYRVVYNKPSIVGGQELIEIHIDIIFRKNTYLKYYNINPSLNDDLTRIKSMQEEELEQLIYTGALKKKYQYLFNGEDTSVLEMNSSLDKLWFACLPSLYILQNESSSNDKVFKYVTENVSEPLKQKFQNQQISNNGILEEQVIKLVPKGFWESPTSLPSVRNLTSNRKLYLDDFYYCIDNDTKQKALSQRSILEKYELLNMPSNKESTNGKVNETVSLTGYHNIYQAGNLVEMKLKILGDPYWLKQFSDNVLVDSIEASTLHNFAFSLKTPIGQKQDGTYNLEDACEFSTIYQLIESTSVFEDGKFIQQLKGVINPAFIFSGTVKV